MAWSSAVLTSDEVTLAAADKPLLAAKNAAASVSATSQWRTSGSWASGSDGTHADYPATNGYDFGGDHDTRPSSAQTTWYYLMQWASGAPDFDLAVILGHNFGTIGGLTVTLEIADDNAFTTNLQTIATWTPGTSNDRLVSLSLKHTGSNALRYSTVPYARMKLTKGSSFTPQFTEIWLGRRRQLRHAANRPHGLDNTRSGVSEFVSQSGGMVRTTFYKGQAERRFQWDVANATEISDVKSWWSESEYGTRPFIYIEKPNANPGDAHFMWSESDGLSLPEVGPGHRLFDLPMVEQTPFLSAEA